MRRVGRRTTVWKTPVTGRFGRTARSPDHDRYYVAIGASLAATEHVRVDVGYAHLFSAETSIQNPDPITGDVLRGRYRGSGDLFSAQLTWRFH